MVIAGVSLPTVARCHALTFVRHPALQLSSFIFFSINGYEAVGNWNKLTEETTAERKLTRISDKDATVETTRMVISMQRYVFRLIDGRFIRSSTVS